MPDKPYKTDTDVKDACDEYHKERYDKGFDGKEGRDRQAKAERRLFENLGAPIYEEFRDKQE